eukprot:1158557-Pelagomonas_calceolata.AAC.4
MSLKEACLLHCPISANLWIGEELQLLIFHPSINQYTQHCTAEQHLRVNYKQMQADCYVPPAKQSWQLRANHFYR